MRTLLVALALLFLEANMAVGQDQMVQIATVCEKSMPGKLTMCRPIMLFVGFASLPWFRPDIAPLAKTDQLRPEPKTTAQAKP